MAGVARSSARVEARRARIEVRRESRAAAVARRARMRAWLVWWVDTGGRVGGWGLVDVESEERLVEEGTWW